MILVMGATGRLGGAVTDALLAQGRAVRAGCRTSAQCEALRARGAEPVLADLKDRAALERACDGASAVLTTANALGRELPDSLESVDRLGTQALIDAAHSGGARHFVYVSALGADRNSAVPLLAAKGATEDYLRASGVTFTILRPNAFMDTWVDRVVGEPVASGRAVVLAGEGLRKHSFVCAKDVAAFACAALENPRACGRTIPVGGPEAICWRDVVAAYERYLGNPIEVRTASDGALPDGLPAPVQALLRNLERFDSPIDMREVADEFGIRLHSLEDYIKS